VRIRIPLKWPEKKEEDPAEGKSDEGQPAGNLIHIKHRRGGAERGAEEET